jgi:hypothetical protein
MTFDDRLRDGLASRLDPRDLLRRAGYLLGLCCSSGILLAWQTAAQRAMPNLGLLTPALNRCFAVISDPPSAEGYM